tara:strand:+ start:40 stop:318 length:279 start_codon:yes stop_codon:yes gene_type:complete
MIYLIIHKDFDNYENEKENRITNYHGFQNYKCKRPVYDTYDDENEYETNFILQKFLLPELQNKDLNVVYNKSKRIDKLKCFDDKICKVFFNK